MTSRKPSPVPAYLVERLAKGELPEAQAVALRAKLNEEPGGFDKAMSELAMSDEEIFAQHPSHIVANEVRRRAGIKAAPQRQSFFVPVLAFAALGALALFAVLPRTGTPLGLPGADGEETIGIKGAKPHLVVYRKRQGAPQRLDADDSVAPGDVLQVAYVVPPDASGAAAPYGVVVSIDANKAITLHLPTQAGVAQRLQTNGENRLSNAYELDSSRGFERFWLVMSPSPFDSRDVTSALQSGAPLPAGTTSFHITFTKEL